MLKTTTWMPKRGLSKAPTCHDLMQLRPTRLATTRENPRGLFIDRWGTLCSLPASGFAKRPSDVEFLPGALDALFNASRLGWNIYVIGNEDSVAFGALSEAAWKKIDGHIQSSLIAHGIPLKRSYACLEHPEAGAPHAQPSVFRLPETGAFFHAMHNDGIDLSKSWVIGDSTIELAAAWRADLRSIGVRTGVALKDETLVVEPELMAEDLASAIAALTRAGAEAA